MLLNPVKFQNNVYMYVSIKIRNIIIIIIIII